MQSDTSIAGKGKTPSASDSIGGEPTLQANGNTGSEAQPPNNPGILNSRRTRLVLPDRQTNVADPSVKDGGLDQGCSFREGIPAKEASSSKKFHCAGKRGSWDFPTPDCHIMKFIDEPTPPVKESNTNAHVPQEAPGSALSLDGFDNKVYEIWEAQAIQINEQAKAKHRSADAATAAAAMPAAAATSAAAAASTGPRSEFSNTKLLGATSKVAGTPQVNGTSFYAAAEATRTESSNIKTPGATTKVGGTPQAFSISKTSGATEKVAATEQTGDLSITPDYAPPPRRGLKMTAALQSPYVDVARKISFKCSASVVKVYNAVRMSSGRSTRASKKKEVIMNYLFNYATLGHLADSVKPGGKLINTIAEIGIHVINGKKTRGATRWVMPLHITTLLQSQLTQAAAVTHAFQESQNNLDHRQMTLVSTDVHSGHYFLIVLNLHNNRFEVLDSMRSLQNEKLSQCCTTIINEIKKLWTSHYAGTQKQIENYGIVDIGVPKQGNK
ncbi:hypothetical protein C2845_PM09G10370 [Panicum miliaceum]|uniref:Ubiquitin-like protease family profile domain-containing protein n=1 Tax=Panicum miliaceum TaxID=4540 RepID=A0A3L6RZK5_PANMI|nr:hypothetical protein C2845_PM09G10370 [Panicum miliaceum]